MAHDENFTRFFCFLSLFAARDARNGHRQQPAAPVHLLGIGWAGFVSLDWLLVSQASAAAAAKKAFITTRIGDIGLLARNALALPRKAARCSFTITAMAAWNKPRLAKCRAARRWHGGSTVHRPADICGAIGKSGQLPLHVWLPDAMEGPTPVSALIHAATMVAAGVFLVARVYPLMSAAAAAAEHPNALQVVTWVGAFTAVFAAAIAVAQNDIKRILAYSTISQLGYMMMGLGVGGVAVGMFHLITHAFFKALLFLGAGSVIHGCHDEQDIRKMGGLAEGGCR